MLLPATHTPWTSLEGVPPPPGAERRRRRRKGKTGKNHCGFQKPLSEQRSCRCLPQRAQVSAGVGKPPHGLGMCIWLHLVNGTGNSPSPGRPTPGVVKQDKSSGGSVDTTKTRLDPRRVRMSSGERPIGAAKGKQSDTEAPSPNPGTPRFRTFGSFWNHRNQWRGRSAALCRLQEGSMWVWQSVGVAVIPCALVFWGGGCWAVALWCHVFRGRVGCL